jgi:uncharacterized protein YbjT (DUF2867 family)
MKLLLVGATGAVGKEVLGQTLADSRVKEVIALTRKPLVPTEKLRNIVVDFASLPKDAEWWAVDGVICTLGTTIRVAGSKEKFLVVDRDLPIAIGKHAREAGARGYALNSSLGASSAAGNFYLRTKGQAEDGILALGYPRTVIVRPSIIDAKRADSRPGEALALSLMRPLRGLIPGRWRAVTPEAIARALIEGVLSEREGVEIIESGKL